MITNGRRSIRCSLPVLPVLAVAWLALSSLSAAQTPTTSPHRNVELACDRCHTTEAWSTIKNDSGFDHAQTSFALTGRHANVSCAGCHLGRGLQELTSECRGCHADPHRAEFGIDCARCHTVVGWRQPARFVAMHEVTRFPLLGTHRQLECKACHANQQKNEFVSVSVSCATCHRGDYNASRLPGHAALGFPLACEECHDVERPSWIPARYRHRRFAPEGAHAVLACQDCHKGSYEGNSVECFSCHRDDFNRAMSPNHLGGNYPTKCANCHNTSTWRPAQVNHDLTGFPLTGGHDISDCKRCHTGGQYSGLSKECITCHEADFKGTTNPQHAGRFPTACTTCHTTTSWKPATFDHASTRFPLTGRHTATPCVSCHVNGQWSGLPIDCYACHATDYTRVTNPNHAGANYPRDCTPCHTTSGWKPSTFAHDPKFPIYTGKHRGEWTRCTDCHTNAANYLVYSCVDCHEHNKTETDSQHRGVRNYSYVSTECYRCHPTGGGG